MNIAWFVSGACLLAGIGVAISGDGRQALLWFLASGAVALLGYIIAAALVGTGD